MKRFSLVLGLALALSLVFAAAAYANFGPHGGYIEDTDSCAGCHRAHSSFSEVTFTPSGGGVGGGVNALLVGSATTMTEFCNACHGDLAPGASTNVQSGVFDSGPSADGTILATGGNSQANGDSDGGNAAVVQYLTESTFNAPLNGGGFGNAAGQILDTATWEDSGNTTRTYKAVTSAHTMEAVGVLWGAGASVSSESAAFGTFTCTGCHDPHGSSNYRLLKDSVNGNTTGGYAGDVPQGWVFSTETGYDQVVLAGGWLKHQPGADQMAAYRPNYTSGSTQIKAASGISTGSLSQWCAGCHEQYATNSSAYDYEGHEGGGAIGSKTRHRHPVDISLMGGDGILEIAAQEDGNLDQRIPLEDAEAPNIRANKVGCLTCHFAHGSTAVMSGWSNAKLVQNQNGTWVPEKTSGTTMGVEPDRVDDPANAAGGTSALLRADNRGVCERCHDK